MISGVAVSGEVDVVVQKARCLKITMPLVKTVKELVFLASHEDLYAAVEKATHAMADFLAEKVEISLNEAGMLMSACGNVQISQVVSPEKTVRFSMPLEVLAKLGVDTDF